MRVPVPKGAVTTARDAQFTLTYDANNGVITGATLDSEIASPAATSRFLSGIYKNPVNNCQISLSQPVIGNGGRHIYTVNTNPAKCGGTGAGHNVQLQFTTGKIKGHPNSSLFKNSGCTYQSPERAYGIGLSGVRNGIGSGELTYVASGPSSLTLTGLQRGGNQSCLVSEGENFNYCSTLAGTCK